jgi:hypothetical protein
MMEHMIVYERAHHAHQKLLHAVSEILRPLYPHLDALHREAVATHEASAKALTEAAAALAAGGI